MRTLNVFFTLLILTVSLSACSHTEPQTHESHGDNSSKSLYSVGDISHDELKNKHAGFFHEDDFVSNSDLVEKLSQVSSELKIVGFFGAWCHDSQREVPRMLKLLERANNANITMKLIALDIQKSEPQGRAKQADITNTPTFVVYKDGAELGRIIEKPETSLAQELLDIING